MTTESGEPSTPESQRPGDADDGPIPPAHPGEPHAAGLSSRLNWLRAGVLGANDGIVSTAGLVVGVAAATTERGVIATAGIAGLVAGAVSMALGEYVSVSTQRDTEKAMLAKERRELTESPDEEFAELISMYRSKGLSAGTAKLVAQELTDHDAFAAHVDIELGIDPDELTNPWHAAYASALAFTLGAALPLLAILLPPANVRIPDHLRRRAARAGLDRHHQCAPGRIETEHGRAAHRDRRRAGDGGDLRRRSTSRHRRDLSRSCLTEWRDNRGGTVPRWSGQGGRDD